MSHGGPPGRFSTYLFGLSLFRMLDIIVRGKFITSQPVPKLLKDSDRIIVISSCVGERMMIPRTAAYPATKGAVKVFTQVLSREVDGRGIRVN